MITTTIHVDEQDGSPFVLRKEIASGKYEGKDVVLTESHNNATMFIEYEGKTYKIDKMNLVAAVLDVAAHREKK